MNGTASSSSNQSPTASSATDGAKGRNDSRLFTLALRIALKVCEPVVRHVSDGGLLVNYQQLPEAIWTAILPHFGVACSAGERAAMAAAARHDAKAPAFEFAADSAAKQQEASEATRGAAERWLGDLYRRLEARHAGG